MNLQLENINAIVENDKLQPILSTRMYSGLQDQGLFSENIFGKLGSKERSKTFAYVNLSTKIIHPEAFNLIFMSVDPIFGKFLLNKQKYSLDKLGNLIEDENGVSGVFHFVKLFPKINLDTFKKKSPKEINFIRENSKKIFIDKYLVLPAGVRDIVISKSTGKQQIQYSDLNELYGSLISMSSTMKQMKSSPDLAEPMAQNIQRYTIKINDWIKSRLKGKTGLIRGGLLRKTTDFSGRLLITTDNTLKMGEIGLPYQVVLRLYEPLALYHIQRSNDHLAILQHFFKQDTQIDTYQLKMLFKKLNTTPDILPALIKDYFIEVAKEIVKDKVIIYKRDQWSLYAAMRIE